jgi:glycosyltransferase involved in cell wall biosynthesis
MPDQNLAARIVRDTGAGLSASPDDPETFAAAAAHLVAHPALRADMASRARAYAERSFDIQAITAKFEMILTKPTTRAQPTMTPAEFALKTSWS